MDEGTLDLLFSIFMLICGLLWTTVYILIIYKGFKDKVYAMPLAAFCANIAWEAIFAFFPPLERHSIIQTTMNAVWFSFDVVILYQIIRYAPKEFKLISKKLFYPLFATGIAFAVATIYLMSKEFNDAAGAYAAFGQNMMMSILFVTMLYQRGSTKGQMLTIALLKWIGTLLSAIAFGLFLPESDALHGSLLMLTFFIGIFVFDTIYFVLLLLVKLNKIEFGNKIAKA